MEEVDEICERQFYLDSIIMLDVIVPVRLLTIVLDKPLVKILGALKARNTLVNILDAISGFQRAYLRTSELSTSFD